MFKQPLYKTVLIISLGILFLLSTMFSLAQTDDSVELVGIIEEMTTTTITVNQQVINIVGAELNIPLEIGTLVKIEGSLSATGEITGREVNTPDEGTQAGEAELTGILESFDGSTMVINGQVVDVSTAEIDDGIVVGELVKVHVTANDDGTWQAREAEPIVASAQDDSTDDSGIDDNSDDDNSDDGMQPGEFEIVGTLEEIGDGFVVVSGQTIDVSTAELNDILVVGVQVKIHLQSIDGSLVAREVENSVGDDDTNDDSTDDDTNTNDNTANTNTADDNGNDNSSNTNTADDNGNDNSSNTNDNVAGVTAVTLEDAVTTVLSIYPNTTITEIELDDDFGDALVWKIETSHGIELKIDAQTGVILTIEHQGDDNSSNNVNTNSDDNHVDDNSGSNHTSNDNYSDDHSDDRGDDHSNNDNNSHENDDDHGDDDHEDDDHEDDDHGDDDHDDDHNDDHDDDD